MTEQTTLLVAVGTENARLRRAVLAQAELIVALLREDDPLPLAEAPAHEHVTGADGCCLACGGKAPF